MKSMKKSLWQHFVQSIRKKTQTVEFGHVPTFQQLEPRILMSATTPGISYTPPVVSEDHSLNELGGQITIDTTLDDSDVWHVTADVIIPSGVTLTISPGVTLEFDNGAGIIVQGRLLALGTAQAPIEMLPASGETSWDGIDFENTNTDNQLIYVNMDRATGGGHSIDLDNSTARIDHVVWSGTSQTILEISDSNAWVSNSVFPSINNSEAVHGSGIPTNGYLVFDGNIFGTTTGYSDVIDFTGGKRPNAVIELYDNIFTGGSDDVLDLDGTDAHIEGNIFMNIHQDAARSSSSNAIATGKNGNDASVITVVRNYFFDVDHAMLLKDESSAIFHNNTVIGSTIAAINFDEPNRSGVVPGASVDLEGNIFWNNVAVFENQFSSNGEPDPVIAANNNIIPAAFHALGIDNLDIDPLLIIDEINRTFTLDPSSQAIGIGPNGINLGADVPQWTSVTGLLGPVTVPDVTLVVDSPGIVRYQYSLDDQPFSALIDIDTPIELTGLADGAHNVRILGENSAGRMQPIDDATTLEWIVGSDFTEIRINEVLVENNGVFEHEGTNPEYIEIFNSGGQPVNLSDMTLSDDSSSPNKFVFPSITLQPGEYVLVYSDSDDNTSGLHANFSLNKTGEGVYLYNSQLNGGGLVDSVVFGNQLINQSIGRIGFEANWMLNNPTPGELNSKATHAKAFSVVINEYLAASQVTLADDFIELYNPLNIPVDLGEFHISDDPDNEPDAFKFAPLHFMLPGQFLNFIADDSNALGHLPFKLASSGGSIVFSDNNLNEIDRIDYDVQQSDIAFGLAPDGTGSLVEMAIPTPGLGNISLNNGGVIVQPVQLLAKGSQWSYLDEMTNSETGNPAEDYPLDAQNNVWSSVNFDTSTSDPAIGTWKIGNGIFGDGGLGDGAPPVVTILDGIDDDATGERNTVTTYLFRTTVSHPNASSITELDLEALYDDGMVIYVNGIEVDRFNMEEGTVTSQTFADGATGNENYDSRTVNVAGKMVDGVNVIAVELHQTSVTSSDVGFDLEINAEVSIPVPPQPVMERMLIDQLRVSELMYNPLNDGDTEFIELTNIGTEVLDLSGVRLNQAVDFTFDQGVMLQPGEIIVLVRDIDAFRAKYPNPAIKVAGDYNNSFSNDGETLIIQLPNPYDGAILKFTYNDNWIPYSDGLGVAMMADDLNQERSEWDDSDGWSFSGLEGGTPGRIDPVGVAVDGDANFDGLVNIVDLAKLASNYGRSAVDPGDVIWGHGDFNGDGVINIVDLSKLASNFRGTGPDGFPVLEAGAAAADDTTSSQGAILLNNDDTASDDNPNSWDHINSLLDESDEMNLI